MLDTYNISTEDIRALIEVLRSVKDRGLDYVSELEELKTNGFKETLIDVFGTLDYAKTYFQTNMKNYPDMQGGISLLIDYINRLSR